MARRLRPDDGEGAVARQLHGQLVAERAQEMETESQIEREIARATILAETTAGSDQGHGNVYASWPEDGDRGGNVSEIAVEYAATPVIYPPTEPVRMCTWIQPSPLRAVCPCRSSIIIQEKKVGGWGSSLAWYTLLISTHIHLAYLAI